MKTFKEELKALMECHQAKLVEHAEYNDEEEYCGSHFTFEGPDWTLYISELVEDKCE